MAVSGIGRVSRRFSGKGNSQVRHVESLESRVMLHGGSADMPADLMPYVSDGHIKLSDFLKVRPQFAGTDVWATSTFNPLNTTDATKWNYNPHWIEDDRPLSQQAADINGEPVIDPASVTTDLPDIVPLTSNGYLQPYLDTTEIPGHNLVRFSTAVANMGGPLILTSSNTAVDPQGRQIVTQNIYSYDSVANTFSLQSTREAGRFVYHPGHGHFHFEGYATYQLRYNNNGTPGDIVMRSDGSQAVGDKVGFCLINLDSSFTIPGTSTSSTTLPGYHSSTGGGTSSGGQPSTSCGFIQGIHTGHADVYDSVFDGQWIDVTGVPNGNYFVEVTLDGNNAVLESNEDNNTVFVPYTLNATSGTGGIQPDRFEPNNTFAQATDLGEMGVQTQSGLTAHITDESDYFKFVAASSGTYSVQLSIGDRDVNLYVYDSAQNLLGASTNSATGSSSSPATESVTTTFVKGQTYYALAKGFGSGSGTSGVSSNYALKLNILPTVDPSTPISSASEVNATPGRFTIARNGPVSGPVIVNFSIGGTATRGVDYNIYQDGVLVTGNTITIGNEAHWANLDVVPVSDGSIEPAETVTLTVAESPTAYVLGSGATQSILIADTPPVVLSRSYQYETGPTGVSVVFSLDVSASLDPADLTIRNLSDNSTFHPDGETYDTATNTAYFSFASPLPDGRYVATLKGSSVSHAQGAPLTVPADLPFFVLDADANRDRKVDIVDLGIVASNWQSAGRTFSQGDFNLDGKVDIVDLGILAGKWQSTVSPVGSLVAGASNPSNPAAPSGATTATVGPLRATAQPSAFARSSPLAGPASSGRLVRDLFDGESDVGLLVV